jgi:lactoylglutathione lyase
VIKRISFTTVPVLDQSRALEFYTKKLGLTVFTDQPMGAERWIELKVNGGETMLVLHKHTTNNPGPSPALVFVVDNVRATYDELKAKGVEFTQPPKKETWGEHAIFKDSEGNLVMIGNG